MATKKSKQVQTAVLVSPELLHAIDEAAAVAELSRSDIIRRWLNLGRMVEQQVGSPSGRKPVQGKEGAAA